MYKKSIYFPNVEFNIITNNKDAYIKQLKHISQFYIPYYGESTKIINMEYIEDINLFNNILEEAKLQKSKSYQSFTNQIHKEYENNIGEKYYIVDNHEYICMKESDDYYKIITNGKEEGTKWLFRVIREILVRINEENGGLYMHGTALNIDNNGILILGNSGSGKTTLATKMLESGEEVNFLSNDRVFIYSNNRETMEYFPIPIVYAMGTVKNCDALNDYFKRTRILETRTGIKYEKSSDNTKVDVPLTHLSGIFTNCEMIPTSNINLIIFSKLNKYSDKDYIIRKLTPKEQIIKLNQTCFTPFDWESLRLEWIYKRNMNMNDLVENKINTIDSIVKNVEILEVEYGLNINNKKLIKKIKGV